MQALHQLASRRSGPLARRWFALTTASLLIGFALAGSTVSYAQPKPDPAPDASGAGAPRDKALKSKQPAAKVSSEQATKIAVGRMPGMVTSVTIERKRGKNVYVVEIQTPRGEKDVLVDIESGEILGTE
jgi:hypothetical protein